MQRGVLSTFDIGTGQRSGRLIESVGEACVSPLPRLGVPAQPVAGAVAQLGDQGHLDGQSSAPRCDACRREACGRSGRGKHAQLLAVFFFANLRDSRFKGPAVGHSSNAKPVSVLTRLSPFSRYITYCPRRSLKTSPAPSSSDRWREIAGALIAKRSAIWPAVSSPAER